MSIVRDNLMTQDGYTPYCGNLTCSHQMPRSVWNGKQFECACGWVSEFPKDFIDEYKNRWALKTK
jgi:hypothetical protein